MTKSPVEYQTFILDLDNTLYDEKHYLYPAYNAISQLAHSHNSETPELLYAIWLQQNFRKTGRQGLLDRLIESFKLDSGLLPEMLTILRNVEIKGGINLYPEIYAIPIRFELFQIQYFVLTNGNKIQQQNKIKQINWENIQITEFVFASDFEPKPSAEAFSYISSKYNLDAKTILSIGDSETDKIASEKAGIDFMWIDQFKSFLRQEA